MIPRILHQIWVGPDPLPEEFDAYRETWRTHHPEWELRLWDEDNLPSGLRHGEVYERERTPAERADILRLELLWRHGGVYADVDFECCRPLDDLLEGVELFAAELKPGERTNNALIGATPGHPLIARALQEVRIQEPGAVFDKTASGSLFFDAIIRDQPGVTIFPAQLVFPATPAQRATAYAIHHAARSWKDGAGWRQSTLRAEERLDRALHALEEEIGAHATTRKKLARAQEQLAAQKRRAKAPHGTARAARWRKFSFLRSE